MGFPERFCPPDFAWITLSLECLVTLGTTKSECLHFQVHVYIMWCVCVCGQEGKFLICVVDRSSGKNGTAVFMLL